MGKGDKKSKKGKIFNGSFGKRRPRKKKTNKPLPVKEKKKESPKKDTAEETKASASE